MTLNLRTWRITLHITLMHPAHKTTLTLQREYNWSYNLQQYTITLTMKHLELK